MTRCGDPLGRERQLQALVRLQQALLAAPSGTDAMALSLPHLAAIAGAKAATAFLTGPEEGDARAIATWPPDAAGPVEGGRTVPISSGERRLGFVRLDVPEGEVGHDAIDLLVAAGAGISLAMERARVEAALRASEAWARKLALVASRTSNGVVMADPAGRIEWVNDGFTRLTGYTLDEVRGKTPGSVLQGPETDPATRAFMRERVRKGEGFRVEVQNHDKHGRRYWCDVEVVPVRDEAGRFVGFLSIESDISSRRQAHDTLASTMRLLTTLIENINRGVLVEDATGHILHANEQLCTMFALPVRPAGLVGSPVGVFAELAGPRLSDPAALRDALGSADPGPGEALRRVEHEIPLANGSTYEMDVVPIDLEEGQRGRLWLYRDVTALKRAERAMADAVEQDVRVASEIQQVLLLARAPSDLRGATVSTMARPSARVDGDFVDFFRHDHDRFDVLVGDVMGKGVPAALFGAALKGQFARTLGLLGGSPPDPHEVVGAVHEAVAEELIRLERFATLSFARFDIEERVLRYVGCGHPNTIHCRAATGTCELLPGENVPLGFSREERYIECVRGFEPGDVFVFYSDGITEARSPSGEMFGVDRLVRVVAEGRALDPDGLTDAIWSAVEGFTGSTALSDDVTCVVVRIGDSPKAVHREVSVQSDVSHLPAVRDLVREACSGLQVAPERVDSMVLAVHEALVNVIRHAYEGRTDRTVLVEIDAWPDRVVVVLRHEGLPLDRHGHAAPPIFDGSRERGFGLFIIERSVDSVAYFADDRGRHCVRLVLRAEMRPPAMRAVDSGSREEARRTEVRPMDMYVEDVGNVKVVVLQGDSLDASNSREFREGIQPVLDQGPRLVFDMGKVRFVDSSGLGAILSCLRQANARGGDLRLCAMTRPVRALFELVRMHRVFGIFNTREEAVSSYQDRGG